MSGVCAPCAFRRLPPPSASSSSKKASILCTSHSRPSSLTCPGIPIEHRRHHTIGGQREARSHMDMDMDVDMVLRSRLIAGGLTLVRNSFLSIAPSPDVSHPMISAAVSRMFLACSRMPRRVATDLAARRSAIFDSSSAICSCEARASRVPVMSWRGHHELISSQRRLSHEVARARTAGPHAPVHRGVPRSRRHPRLPGRLRLPGA